MASDAVHPGFDVAADGSRPRAAEAVARRIHLAHEPHFRLGPLAVEPAMRRIVHVDGREEIVEPRVMQVLVALLRAGGSILSRDDLVECCWDGRIVGDDAIHRVMSRLRRTSEGIGQDVFRVETVTKVGYRMALAPDIARPPAPTTPQAPRAALAPRRSRLLAALLAIVVLAIGTYIFMRPSAPVEPASVAVMPFRTVSADDRYFAEGVTEQILIGLRREPQLKVAGSASTRILSNFFEDAREVGRRLGVAHVLEGTVRSEGNRLRVDVTLVDTGDGRRLWSETFQGSIDQIFASENAIRSEVVKRLGRRATHTAPLSGPLATRGEIYRLYLRAQGLSRESSAHVSRVGPVPNRHMPEQLLRQVVRMDPNYAPGWAALSLILSSSQVSLSPSRLDEAERYANRALLLAPDLAEARQAAGVVHLGQDRGRAHLERAVQLDPGNGASWEWLASARAAALDFEGALQARRRAAEIDPFSLSPVAFANLAWEMGFREEALRVERLFLQNHPDPAYRELARAHSAARRGDWSGVILHNRRGGRSGVIGHLRVGRQSARVQRPTALTTIWEQVMNGEVPALRSIPEVIARPIDFWRLPGLWETSAVASRLLLTQGRGVELVELYDGAFNSPEAMVAENPGVGFPFHAANVAIALRDAGRTREADRLLDLADQAVTEALRRGAVTHSFHVICARIWALQGKREQSLSTLELAVAMGWPMGMRWPNPWAPKADLAAEEAFRSLRDEPRFQRLHATTQADLARERREIESMGI